MNVGYLYFIQVMVFLLRLLKYLSLSRLVQVFPVDYIHKLNKPTIITLYKCFNCFILPYIIHILSSFFINFWQLLIVFIVSVLLRFSKMSNIQNYAACILFQLTSVTCIFHSGTLSVCSLSQSREVTCLTQLCHSHAMFLPGSQPNMLNKGPK